MEISEKEYNELKLQIATLQNTVNDLKNPPKRTIKTMLKEQVIDGIHNLNNEKPVFGYSRFDSKAWKFFLEVGKIIHEPTRTFYMGTALPNRPYIRTNDLNRNIPQKVKDLSPEQMAISAKMLDEIIPIYNRYYKMLHPKVMYDPTGKGDYELIGVLDFDMIEERS